MVGKLWPWLDLVAFKVAGMDNNNNNRSLSADRLLLDTTTSSYYSVCRCCCCIRRRLSIIISIQRQKRRFYCVERIIAHFASSYICVERRHIFASSVGILLLLSAALLLRLASVFFLRWASAVLLLRLASAILRSASARCCVERKWHIIIIVSCSALGVSNPALGVSLLCFWASAHQRRLS